MKQYIIPATQAQTITANQLLCGSIGIGKGDPVTGTEQNPYSGN